MRKAYPAADEQLQAVSSFIAVLANDFQELFVYQKYPKSFDEEDRAALYLDCFKLLLAQHLADVFCFIALSMASRFCMEIHTEIVQKREKEPSHSKGTPRQPHVYL